MMYQAIKFIYFLNVFNFIYSNNNQNNLLDNELLWVFNNIIPSYDKKDLEKIIFECYDFINKSYTTFKQEKVTAIYSYNKDVINTLLNKHNNLYQNKFDLTKFSYKDKIQLFYIAGKTFPFNKYISLIFVSEKRMNIIKNINNNLYIYLMEIFNKSNVQLKINKNIFDIIYLDDDKPQLQNIKKNYLGNSHIEFEFTRMEDVILKESFKDDFLWKYDNLLPSINFIIYVYNKSLTIVEDSTWYEKIKHFVLNNNLFPKSHSLESVVRTIPHYIFDNKNKDINGSIKQDVLDIYLLRLIYYVYLYIY